MSHQAVGLVLMVIGIVGLIVVIGRLLLLRKKDEDAKSQHNPRDFTCRYWAGDMSGSLQAVCLVCNPKTEVNLDKGSVPLGDFNDATSLMFTLSMKYGEVMVTGGPEECIVAIQGKTFTGRTELEALQKAQRELEK